MKFSILAIDYDGTMARHGHALPEVVAAIREARSQGITVVLVTGRILDDLRRVLTEEDLFDVIVTENGAVLGFPNGGTRVLGRPASRELLSELCEGRIECAFGECIIEADAATAPKILEAIRRLELPLMRFGVAAGAAAVMNPGTELCRREDTERLFRQIER
jgi:hydroxymethylpyrimidine pyrophosphatase-like HAD family hydrolase